MLARGETRASFSSFEDFKRLKISCDQGQLDGRIQAMGTMDQTGPSFSINSFSYFVQGCINKKDLRTGRKVHAIIIKKGLQSNSYLGSYLIRMFDLCGSLSEANEVFNKLQEHNCFTWSAIISAHVNHGQPGRGIGLYFQMQRSRIKPDGHAFVAVLKACVAVTDLGQGKVLHTHILESGFELNVFVSNTLIDMYAKCGSLKDGRRVFDNLSNRDIVTWNAMIAGYTQNGLGHEALYLFQKMQQECVKPDAFTLVSTLKACSIMAALDQGKMIHDFIIHSGVSLDIYVGSSLMDMYAKCGSLEDALRVFGTLPKRNRVIWNTMIAGYVQCARGSEALELLHKMRQEGKDPDTVTFISILKACSSLGDLDQGKTTHTDIINNCFELDLFVGNTLIDMYAKCGSIEDARKVFDKLSVRDEVTWNAMISGYAQHGYDQVALQLLKQMQEEGRKPGIVTCNAIIVGRAQHGQGQEALQFFSLMQDVGMEPDNVTFASILKACSSIAAIDQGKVIHAIVIKRGCELDVFVGSTLIDMYIKCGNFEDAFRAFQKLPKGDVVIWNAMIAGYVLHNEYELALRFYRGMQGQGLKPDDVTFVSLLSVCSRMGLVDAACQYFDSMAVNHGIPPTLGHYNCMVDLLGRGGRLYEAENLLKAMPYGFSIFHWTSLLTNCRTYGNAELGRRCFDQLVAIDHRCASAYVLMFNIYAGADRWGEANKIRALKRSVNAWKKPGKACIEIDNAVHDFIVGDKSHPKIDHINAKLKLLKSQMEAEGRGSFLDFVPIGQALQRI